MGRATAAARPCPRRIGINRASARRLARSRIYRVENAVRRRLAPLPRLWRPRTHAHGFFTKALGVTIPPPRLKRADHTIERASSVHGRCARAEPRAETVSAPMTRRLGCGETQGLTDLPALQARSAPRPPPGRKAGQRADVGARTKRDNAVSSPGPVAMTRPKRMLEAVADSAGDRVDVLRVLLGQHAIEHLGAVERRAANMTAPTRSKTRPGANRQVMPRFSSVPTYDASPLQPAPRGFAVELAVWVAHVMGN
jgi:hypothetical protein